MAYCRHCDIEENAFGCMCGECDWDDSMCQDCGVVGCDGHCQEYDYCDCGMRIIDNGLCPLCGARWGPLVIPLEGEGA